jgi:hypothetical protein
MNPVAESISPSAESFHAKPWFKAGVTAHGHDSPLHTEPHDLAPISQKLLESFESQGFPIHHDIFTTGEVPHNYEYMVRTHHPNLRTTGADFMTKDYHHNNTEILTRQSIKLYSGIIMARFVQRESI